LNRFKQLARYEQIKILAYDAEDMLNTLQKLQSLAKRDMDLF